MAATVCRWTPPWRLNSASRKQWVCSYLIPLAYEDWSSLLQEVYCFVRSNDDLFLCPLLNSRVGNIREQPVEALFHSPAASQIRKQIGRYPECRHCTEPGLERYSLPYEGFAYLGLLPKMGQRAFLGQHVRMGLDQYFD
jgi:hypothetical protein